MDNHPPNHTKVLSMKICDCEKCPNKLRKYLLRMHGVDYVFIDLERHLVVVTGKIDPRTLVNKVSELVSESGVEVQLLQNEKNPNNHFEGKKHYSTHREKEKPHKSCCCQDGRHYQKKGEKKEEEEHKCEAYVAPKVDERVCRDFYCKVHPKMRKIVDRVPADSSSWFGGLPFHSGYGPYGAESYIYPRWYGEEPPRFGYRRPPPLLGMLQPPFGFQ